MASFEITFSVPSLTIAVIIEDTFGFLLLTHPKDSLNVSLATALTIIYVKTRIFLFFYHQLETENQPKISEDKIKEN